MRDHKIICCRIPVIAIGIALFAILLLPGITLQAHAQSTPSIVWMSSDGARTVTFSSDGKTVADAGTGLSIHLRNAANGALIRSMTTKSGTNSIAFSPNGALLASGRTNGSSFNLNLYRVSDGVLVKTLSGHTNATRAVAFAPNGALMASGGDDKTARFWRVSDGALLRTLSVGLRVKSLAFSPNGALLATGDQGGRVLLWRVSDGAQIRVYSPAFLGTTMSVAFSPDGTKIAAGSLDGTARLWQVSGTLLRTFTLPAGDTNASVASLAFTPDGTKLVSGNDEVIPSEHGTIRFWDIASGQLVKIYTQQTGVYVSSLAFSSLGTLFAYSRATDGVVIVARYPF